MSVMASGITVDSLTIDVKTSADKAAKGLDRLLASLEKVRQASAGGFSGLSSLAKRITKIGEALDGLDMKKLSKLTSFFKATSAVSGAGVTKGLKDTTAQISKTIEKAQMGESGEKTDDGKGASGMITKAGKASAKAVPKLKKFFEQLKRIAVYRLIRTVLKKISESLQTGMKNIYEYSMITKTSFAPTMDKLAVATLSWKNSLGAIGAQIMEELAPALTFLANTFVDINNALSQMIAMLRGASTYTKAKKIEEYAGAWAELNRQLLGFDEINKMSGDTAVSYSDMFEEEVVSTGEGMLTLGIVTAIGTAFAAWKISSFVKDLQTATSLLGGKTIAGSLSTIFSAGSASTSLGGLGASLSGVSGSLAVLASVLIELAAAIGIVVASAYILFKILPDQYKKVTSSNLNYKGTTYLDGYSAPTAEEVKTKAQFNAMIDYAAGKMTKDQYEKRMTMLGVDAAGNRDSYDGDSFAVNNLKETVPDITVKIGEQSFNNLIDQYYYDKKLRGLGG